MTDAELIARLRELDGWVMLGAHTHLAAADRIEELKTKLKTSEEIGRAFEEDAGQLREKLAKAVEKFATLEKAASDVASRGAETGPQWTKLTIALLAARAILAEIKGESHEDLPTL